MELSINDDKYNISLLDTVFNIKFNESLIHQVFTSYKLNSKKGTKFNKNRSNVSGSNKKPWKQKGTGKARSGSKKSPIWRSGGVTFGSQFISYKKKINKKMYNLACKSILSEFIRNNNILVFNNFSIEISKTKLLIEKLKNLNINNNVIIITHFKDINLIRASNNLYKVNIEYIPNINILNVINFSKIIITTESIKYLEKILS
ncbi:50S ribosomal protein L4 [endosymbiont of Pachyrhynchus infernalis]|uniref:50S ribosomal protein L4 n=1 Tax=endosymbiont of Pachyrhynchus infernalis TaxID=1971488 RepID=UPI000DC6FCD4|nr:50S ribosomal protein L4 [endosymbiont of Pachyrhynchus infernalis]BBA84833.1 50S ribosomal protein L4 [endosymbiont of Pachyrhynchus infernalis]